MTNQEKFDEHKVMLDSLKNSFLKNKPSVYDMEKLKYSDDPLHRKACAIIEYADGIYMENVLRPRDT